MDQMICFYRSACIAFLLLIAAWSPSSAQQEEVYGLKASWKVEGDRVIISYELSVPLDKEYEVHVVLKKEGDSTFTVVPQTVSGAIGKIHYAGGTKEINWDYTKDVQDELEGRYRFDFAVAEVAGSGMQWWHYAAGGAAILGGTYAIIKAGEKDTPEGLPGPPRIRP